MRLVELGVIGKPHGYRGEFVAHTDTGRASALDTASQIFIGKSADSASPYQVISATWMPKGWKLKLAGVESDQTVQALRGQSLFINRTDLPATESNEYYLGDLVGCQVRDADTNEEIGCCAGVESTPVPGITDFQDRWLITLTSGETLAVPAVRRFIDKVDVDERVIWLRNLSDLK